VLASIGSGLKQICNHPSQWLRDGDYVPEASGKFARLSALCEEIAARQEKVLSSRSSGELTEPGGGFSRAGVRRARPRSARRDQGARARGARRELPNRRGALFSCFRSRRGARASISLLPRTSSTSDRWWNPAVEEQATDRAFRIGQKRNVLVHKFVCRGTVEEKIDAMLAEKRALAGKLLEGGAEAHLTEMSDADLLRTVSIDLDRAPRRGGLTRKGDG